MKKVVKAHFAKHKEVHGIEYWTLKNHVPWHICEQYEKDKIAYNTFLTERRHRLPKRYARQALRMTTGFNKMVMEELVCQHFFDWNRFPGDANFVDLHPFPKKLHKKTQAVFPSASTIERSRKYFAADGSSYAIGDLVV